MKLIIFSVLFIVYFQTFLYAGVFVIDCNSIIESGEYDVLAVEGNNTFVEINNFDCNSLVVMDSASVHLSGGDVYKICTYDNTALEISGNVTINRLSAYENSLITMTGGEVVSYVFHLWQFSQFIYQGGQFSGIITQDNSKIRFLAGNPGLKSWISLSGNSEIYFSGGFIDSIFVRSGIAYLFGGNIDYISIDDDLPLTGKFHIFGTNLTAKPYGGSFGDGFLSGSWPDNTDFNISIYSGTFAYLHLHEGESPTYCPEVVVSDLNNDCVVDMSDLAIMASDWLVDNREER